MGGQRQQRSVAVADFGVALLGKIVAFADEAGARAVLQTTVAVAHHHDLEEKAVQIARDAHSLQVLFTDRLQIGAQAINVDVEDAGERHLVRNASASKRAWTKVPISTGQSISSS